MSRVDNDDRRRWTSQEWRASFAGVSDTHLAERLTWLTYQLRNSIALARTVERKNANRERLEILYEQIRRRERARQEAARKVADPATATTPDRPDTGTETGGSVSSAPSIAQWGSDE